MRCPIQDRQCKHIQRIRSDGSRGGEYKAEASAVTTGCKRKFEQSAATLKVTLAEKWSGSDPTGLYMSEKYDGMRCLWTGETLVSRNNNPIYAPSELICQLPKKIALDGELYLGRNRFQETMRIVRRTSANVHDWSEVKYMVFDAPNVQGSFPNRLAVAEAAICSSSWPQMAPQTVCKSESHLQSTMSTIEALKGEGVMLRKPDAPYTNGRSHSLLKVKSANDDDAIVIGYEEGTGKNKGRIGALKCLTKDHKVFAVGSGLTERMRDKPPPITTTITYRHQGVTEAGIPRFPTFVRVRPCE